MIKIKTPEQISKIREGGVISSKILKEALLRCKPGVKPLEINNYIDKALADMGLVSWFKEVNEYPYSTCISVNEVWVHGMPSEKPLKEGDIISIDLGVKKEGYYVDHCWTIPVSGSDYDNDIFKYTKHKDPKIEEFLKTGMESLASAISEFKVGNRVGDISDSMQKVIEDKGYSVIREYTGHGVGLDNHEEPFVKCYGTRGAGPELKIGMVFAIEIMYSMGEFELSLLDDGWSVVTSDGSLSAMFEHTVALTENGPEILTK